MHKDEGKKKKKTTYCTKYGYCWSHDRSCATIWFRPYILSKRCNMNKICPNCSKEFPENAKFCYTCGAALIDKPKEDDETNQMRIYCI